MQQLLNSVLLPQITYGLPFLFPTMKQFNALTSAYHRPMQKLMWIPRSVHRAGFAFFFNLPVMQIVRDRELLFLMDSILKLRSVPEIRMNPCSLPVYQLVAENIHRERLEFLLADPSKLNAPKANISPIDQMIYLIHHWKLKEMIPPKADLFPSIDSDSDSPANSLSFSLSPSISFGSSSPASPRPSSASHCQSSTSALSKFVLHNCISDSSHMHSVLHGLSETQAAVGYDVHHFQFHSHSHSVQAPARGTHLLPFYFPSHTHPSQRLASLHLSTLASQNASSFASTFPSPYPILPFISIDHCRLLSRLCLNRSALNAVRAQHNPTVLPDCNCLPVHPPAQTVNHILAHCSNFSQARQQLRAKLRSFIESLKWKHAASFASPSPRPLSYLSHIILASPIVFNHIPKSFLPAFISSTFVFLDFIFKLNPY